MFDTGKYAHAHLLISLVQCHGMSHEFYDILAQVKMTEHLLHCGPPGVHLMVCSWVALFKVMNELQKLPESALVKHPH